MISVCNLWWFVFLTVTVAGLAVCPFLLKTEKARKKFLIIGSIFVFVYLFFYKVVLLQDVDYDSCPWEELPLNLCNIAPILLIFAVYWDNRALKAFCLLNCTIGAIIACVFPIADFDGVLVLSARGIGYWGFHFMVIFLCVSLVTLGQYKPKFKDLLYSVPLFFAFACVMHGVNMAIRSAGLCDKPNYFFTYGLEGNALADLVYNILPIPLVWEVLMLPPVAAVEAVIIAVVRLLQKAADKVHAH